MRELLLASAARAAAALYVEDVFSAYPWTGTGSSQTITTGVNLSSNGGMVWTKNRNASGSNVITDTLLQSLGTSIYLLTDSSGAASNSASYGMLYQSASATGYTVSSPSGNSLISWEFRRSPKFFDIVTYTGNGAASQVIPHALGIAPGMVTAKRRDAAGDWAVWHRSATGDLYLDTAAAQTGSFTQITATSGTTFSVSSNANINGATYVAYLWAHDTSATGIAQCGTFTTDASTNFSATLGWEPQYVLIKTAGAYGWCVFDTARGFVAAPTNTDPMLSPNSSAAEVSWSDIFAPNATGFSGSIGLANQQVFYLAIRRGPMRTPTVGTSVYNAFARAGTGATTSVTGVGFAPDLVIDKSRNTNGALPALFDRLRGSGNILVTSTQTELSDPATVASFDTNGVTLGPDGTYNVINTSGNYINWFFRRAPGFFDIVCYKGTGANQTLTHNLGAAPQMLWIKDRTSVNGWAIWHNSLLATAELTFTNIGSANGYPFLNSTYPTANTLTIGTGANVNTSGDNYIAYLFGSLPGVSSVGGYLGNGATQTINCGFTSGARFVLIKEETGGTGDWLVLDTVRGIINGNDPYLALDTNAVEVTTTDLLTPQSVGFGLTSSALVNTNGVYYAYYAVA